MGGTFLSLKCEGVQGQVPHPAPRRTGPPGHQRGGLPSLSLSWILEPPGIGLVVLFCLFVFSHSSS